MSEANPTAPRALASPSDPSVLDAAHIERATVRLATGDPMLGRLVRRNGTPPSWFREPGFATLVLLILEQQVSLASAAAAYRRLEAELEVVEPACFSRLSDARLRAIGFSRQKASYCRALATAIEVGAVSLAGMAAQSDDDARAELTALRGVGPWTAECYLLFALRRADAWPNGDRALLVSLGTARGDADVPTSAAAETHAEQWRPWRSVAARILWHAYLSDRAR